MNILHNREQNCFLISDERNQELYATHTEVAPAYEGRGYAALLLDALAAYAQETGAKIVPVCPYVIHAFQKHPEKYASVI